MTEDLKKEIDHYLSKKTIYYNKFSQNLRDYLESLYPERSIKEQWFLFKNKMDKVPICELDDCNNEVSFNEKRNEFNAGCCKTHNQKITFLKNYSVDHPLKNKKQKSKLKKSVKEKYGVNNVAQLPETKEKIKKTVKEKYNVESIAELQSTKDKRTATMIERYGVPHAQQNQQIRNKTKQTNMKRFGVEEPLSSKVIREKIYKTNYSKYGSIFPMRNKELLDKRLNTIIEKYDSYSPKIIKIKSNKYRHLDKSIEAENNNETYYYFYKDEIENKKKQIDWIVNPKIEKIVKKVEFKVISDNIRDDFILNNSLYTKDTMFRQNFGAFSNNELVAIFSGFETKKYFEITRFIIKIGIDFSFNIMKEFISYIHKHKCILISFDRRFTPIQNKLLSEAGFEFLGGTEPKKNIENDWDCGKIIYKFYTT